MKPACLILCFVILWIDAARGQRQPGAIWMPSLLRFNGRKGYSPKWLIIHGTAGGSSAENVGAWFQDPRATAATHYIVGRDGKVVQSVDESDAAWANGGIEPGADSWWSDNVNPNYVTISIEHVKPSNENSDVLTPAQKTASFNLVRDIINRHPAIRKAWANSSGGITGHYSMSPISRKRCPGPYPWDELFAFLNGNGNSSGSTCSATVRSSIGLNVRAQPNTRSRVVTALTDGASVQVAERVTGQRIRGNTKWYKISNGYISGAYVRLRGTAAYCS